MTPLPESRTFDLAEGQWTREPPSTSRQPGRVEWVSSARSDFWRETAGVPTAHSGNALLVPVGDDFDITLSVSGEPTDQYDQFGLFVRVNEQRWVKVGVELDGFTWLSAVAADPASDWSREPFDATSVRLRAERRDGALRLYVDDGGWRMIRERTLLGPAEVGVYSCSPKGDGFRSQASW